MKGKAALVTGAASGIGAVTALALAREGAAVLVCDINRDGGRQTVERVVAAGGRGAFCHLEVTQPEAHEQAVDEAVRLFGGLDIAVNCAGVSARVKVPVHQVEPDDWRRVMGINVDGVFYGMRAQIPRMIERGGGAIVNVSSIYGVVGRSCLAAYTASKHAVVGLTRAAALDCAQHGIRVNAVGPGYVDTPLQSRKDEGTRQMQAKLHPLGRFARPQEVAEAIAWLCSDRASFTTGSFQAVDGGFTAQ